MAFKFPFTNYHELNLTWVLEQLKKLFEESEENVETIEGYEDRLSAVEDELPVVEATAEQAATVANAAATLAQTAKATADTANENALTASAQAGLARQEAADAEAEAQAATQAAQQVQAIVQDFDGRITQAEDDASEALQEAQSFENRVNAAINTANNAANTATIAQGIAVNANQNAATALDTAQTADGKAEAAQDTADQNAANIGNLSDLTTTAKSNLVAAINEAAQTGGGTDATKAPLIVAEASGVVASFNDGADNMQIQELNCTIEPTQAGTGVPSPSNDRPISGHTEMNVTRTGKNLFGGDAIADKIVSVTPGAEKDAENKIVKYTAPSINGKILFTNFKPNTRYTFIANTTGEASNLRFNYTDGTVSYISSGSVVVVTQEGKSISSLAGNWSTGLTELKYEDTGLFEGVLTADDFEPYTGESVLVTLPTTIYGGNAEIIGGTLKSTMGVVDLGALDWEKNASYDGLFNGTTLIPAATNLSTARHICSIYVAVDSTTVISQNASIAISANGGTVYVHDNRFTDAASFKAAMSGVQLCYDLAEPVEYTLDGEELTTLYGVNNVFTDVGAIQSCKYPADTKLYIDGKAAELQALILEN